MNIISHSKLFKTLIHWLPMVIMTTLLSGLIYGTVQQNIRLAANDPQIEMAEDTAAALTSGIRLQSVVPAGKTNIAKSLTPYLIVYNESGYPLISTAELDNQIPVPPAGAFKYAKDKGENRITWQPKPGVRSAAVIVPFKGNPAGFVLAGRSLREVEKREDHLFNITFWAWLITNLGTLGLMLLFRNHLV